LAWGKTQNIGFFADFRHFQTYIFNWQVLFA